MFKSLLLVMENCRPITDEVMVVSVHNCAIRNIRNIPGFLNAFNGLLYFLRGDSLMEMSQFPNMGGEGRFVAYH